MKVLINSHVMYKKPLVHLLTSMVNASFHRWKDVVIVMGGAKQNFPPHRKYMQIIRDNVTIVRVTLNALDYTGLSVAWHGRKHPLIHADSYLYLPDSARVGRNFTRLYSNLSRGMRPFDLRKAKGPFSNLCVFGSGLVHRWKDTYDRDFTKAEAAHLETGGAKYTARGARSMIFWARGNITNLAARVQSGTEDPYHTGVPRSVEWYPSFDVYKYVSGGSSGDVAEGKSKSSSR